MMEEWPPEAAVSEDWLDCTLTHGHKVDLLF